MPDIRLAAEADLPAIVEISNRAAATTAANFAVEPEPLDSWRRDWNATRKKFPWLVAAGRDGTVIGFAKASPWKGRCAYNWTAETTIYVRPEHHGRGVGRALYERLISMVRAQGYRTLLGGITVPNPASIGLHESFGFRRVALLERVGWKFGAWHDVGYWELHLQQNRDAPGEIRDVNDVIAEAVIGS